MKPKPLEKKWLFHFAEVKNSGADLDRWICGLGHGCLQWIPQENVRKSVELIQNNFHY